ncbi:response regulator rcp1 [mine drainage metagenome]|uniref:Response regulator rcp1 n=1 Tax=mine drainage metagenome TaxID=410659 RepID=A0A1J5QUT1_9ZZZZ
MSVPGKPIVILLVEDNMGDAGLAKHALRAWGGAHTLFHVQDGVECLTFLRQEGDFADAPRPDLILLDINMPRMNGHETLKAIRADDLLRDIVVVVMTTSTSDVDVSLCYQRGANSYIAKPVEYDHYLSLMRQVGDYWSQVVRLPVFHGKAS